MLRGKLPEYALLCLGLGLTGLLFTIGLQGVLAEQSAKQMQSHGKDPLTQDLPLQQPVPQGEVEVPGGFAGTYLGANGTIKPGEVIGQIRMPALQMSVPILSGITESDLLRGAGHIPGSGFAGGLGNMAVAGHRDTYFRPLRRVEPGMLIFATGTSGMYRYKVDRTEIVTPEQLQILDIGDQPQITLITCYPFNFIGAAPKRFIVFAHLLSAEPDA